MLDFQNTDNGLQKVYNEFSKQ